MSPGDFLRFREELRGSELSTHQVGRMLAEARRWLRQLLDAGALEAERFFLLLHPKGGDYDAQVVKSRAFDGLSASMAATYRRGAQALLLQLRGKDLAGIGRGDWERFREELRARVRRGEIKQPLARMRLSGARRFLEEKVRVGRVRAEVLAPAPKDSPWPERLRSWPGRIEEAIAASGLAASTREHYTRAVLDFLDSLASQGIADLTEVTREVMTAYQLSLQQRAPRSGAPYAVSTQIGILAALRLFFSYLVKTGYLLSDPTSHLAYPRAPRRLPRPLGVGTMRRLLHSLPTTPLGIRDRAILELLYGTGIRGGEAVRLLLQDLDLEGRTLLIREGKGRRDRVVPLGRAAMAALADYLEQVRPKLLQGATSALFLAHHGGALSGRGLRRKLAELGARVGISLHPHLLRHTCATHLLKGRADIRHIQRLLGHKSLATTERYTRVEVSDLREVIRRCHPREKGL